MKNEKQNLKRVKEDFLEKASQEYEGYEVYKDPFIKEQKNLSLLKKQQQSKYDQYLDDVNIRNLLKRGRAIVSPLVMGYGLAVIASASLSSGSFSGSSDCGLSAIAFLSCFVFNLSPLEVGGVSPL